MTETLDIAGHRVLAVAQNGAAEVSGPLLGSEQDAVDLVGEAFGADATVVAVPIERLTPDFLDLSTRKAGLFIQKFVNYGLRVAFIGDLGPRLQASGALRDFVREANRGRTVLFIADLPSLAHLLDPA